MKITKEINLFINNYINALKNGKASTFIGAGFSVQAGMPNWKDLLKSCATELNLNIEEEKYDLTTLAQFYYNEKGNRDAINVLLKTNYQKKTILTENHEILARLPITTFWTTNYDTLIEDSLVKIGKTPALKISKGSLSQIVPNSDVDVYKMHGDINTVEKTVFTRNEYEKYEIERNLFTTVLKGDLVSKTFLFLGFSFNDPNLNFILSRIRLTLEENVRTHYCIFRKINRNNFRTKKEYSYAKEKQKYRIRDLKIYGIQVIEIEEYDVLTEILKEIENRYKQNTIFISGSAETYSPWKQENALKLMHNLSKRLVENEYKIISGFGWGVGSAVINGALEKIYSTKNKHIEEYIILRPFPQFESSKKKLNELWEEYRHDIIKDAGIAIFVFGNKKDNVSNSIVNANGVKREFEIALKYKCKVLPVGATGYMSEKLWENVMDNFDKYPDLYGLKAHIKTLGEKNVTNRKLVTTLINIINKLNKK